MTELGDSRRHDYTPTTNEVRKALSETWIPGLDEQDRAGGWFDRWLKAEVERRIGYALDKAKAVIADLPLDRGPTRMALPRVVLADVLTVLEGIGHE